MRKFFVAPLRAHSKVREPQRRYLFPRLVAKRLHASFNRSRHRVVGDAKYPLDSPDRFIESGPVTKAHEKTVARLLDSLHCNSLQALPQRDEKLAEKEVPIAALQPQLVIMDHDDGFAHASFTRLIHRPLDCRAWSQYNSRADRRVAGAHRSRYAQDVCVKHDNSLDTKGPAAELSTALGVIICITRARGEAGG